MLLSRSRRRSGTSATLLTRPCSPPGALMRLAGSSLSSSSLKETWRIRGGELTAGLDRTAPVSVGECMDISSVIANLDGTALAAGTEDDDGTMLSVEGISTTMVAAGGGSAAVLVTTAPCEAGGGCSCRARAIVSSSAAALAASAASIAALAANRAESRTRSSSSREHSMRLRFGKVWVDPSTVSLGCVVGDVGVACFSIDLGSFHSLGHWGVADVGRAGEKSTK